MKVQADWLSRESVYRGSVVKIKRREEKLIKLFSYKIGQGGIHANVHYLQMKAHVKMQNGSQTGMIEVEFLPFFYQAPGSDYL